jgi:multiple sugar transport system permease protein
VTGVIGGFQVFTPMYVITEGGPLGATDVAVYHIYKRAFQEFSMGYASAQAWVLFAVIFLATLLQLWYVRRRGETSLA